MPWNPQSHSDWARFLGLVSTPLFGKERRVPLPGEHFVLLDGPLSSLVFSHGNVADLLRSAMLAQWAWSANVSHAVVIGRSSSILSVLRWDRPSDVHEHRINIVSDAQKLLSTLASDQPESATTAITPTLDIFRSLRLNLSGYRGNDLDAVRRSTSYCSGQTESTVVLLGIRPQRLRRRFGSLTAQQPSRMRRRIFLLLLFLFPWEI